MADKTAFMHQYIFKVVTKDSVRVLKRPGRIEVTIYVNHG